MQPNREPAAETCFLRGMATTLKCSHTPGQQIKGITAIMYKMHLQHESMYHNVEIGARVLPVWCH